MLFVMILCIQAGTTFLFMHSVTYLTINNIAEKKLATYFYQVYNTYSSYLLMYKSTTVDYWDFTKQ